MHPVSQPTPTQTWFTAAQNPIRTAGRWFFLILVCAYFGFCFGTHPSFLKLDLYTRGLAPTPYQYRVLPMFLFRLLVHDGIFVKLAGHIAPLEGDPYRVTMAGIAFISLFGALLATRGTIRFLTGDRVFSFWAAFGLALMAQLDLASSWDNPFDTPYDVPSVMFFALAIFLVLRRAWWAYYPIFLLAILNRETACFITVFFVSWEWTRLQTEGKGIKARILWIAPQAVLQAVIWCILKLLLARHFAHNPTEVGATGGLFVIKLGYNLRELLKPQQWPLLLSVCGFTLPFLWIQRRWIGSPGFARACGIVLSLSFLGLMLVGVVVEIRIFADWITLAAPAMALIAFNRFRPVTSALTASITPPS